MSKLIDVITNRARLLIDDVAKADWLDPELIRWFNDGRRHITAERPDTRIAADTTEIVFTEKTDLDELRQLDDRWMPAEAEYIAYRAFGEDAGDKRDLDRSEYHWDNFSRLLNIL